MVLRLHKKPEFARDRRGVWPQVWAGSFRLQDNLVNKPPNDLGGFWLISPLLRQATRSATVAKYENGERRLEVIEFLIVVKAIGVKKADVFAAITNPYP